MVLHLENLGSAPYCNECTQWLVDAPYSVQYSNSRKGVSAWLTLAHMPINWVEQGVYYAKYTWDIPCLSHKEAVTSVKVSGREEEEK